MKYVSLLTLCLLFASAFAFAGEETPDWSQRDFSAPVADVYAAAIKSIQQQHHEIKSTDDAHHSVDFHVGTTTWSWGYNMTLTITPIDDAHSHVVIGISRSGGKTVSWGSGKKEVLKIFSGIDKQLSGQTSEKK
ncbi:MAG TPA: hypothetical protein VK466_17075 [Terriglobales bacterium]|nr:hypothetical protein [Terriglobales bacterium]